MGQLTEALEGILLPETAQKVVIDADLVYSKRVETASYIEHLETKVKDFEAELQKLRKQKGISSAAHNLTFDQLTGTYVEGGSGLRHCAKCLSEDKRQPLQKDKYGWKCPVCDKRFRDPNAPLPQVKTDYDPSNPGGSQGWMR